MSDVAEVKSDVAVFYCYNPNERKPARNKYMFAGEGKTVLPDGTKKMDTGFREYRAGVNGVLTVPLVDTVAINYLRKRVSKGGSSGVTEDIEEFRKFTMPVDRQLQRQTAIDAAKDLEIQSLKEQLKKSGGEKPSKKQADKEE